MSLRGNFPSSALANPIVRSEAKDSTALLLCAFILINSQITVGLLMIFLTFFVRGFSSGYWSYCSPEKMGVFRLACLPNALRVPLSDQRSPPIKSWRVTNIDEGLTCICPINHGNNFKRDLLISLVQWFFFFFLPDKNRQSTKQVHPWMLLILRGFPVWLFGNKLHYFLQMRNIEHEHP